MTSQEIFVGTYGHEMALYYAPGSLDDLLPEQGCSYGVDMFPTTAGANTLHLLDWLDFQGGQIQQPMVHWKVGLDTGSRSSHG